jgi:hypothetical protein
VTEASGGGGLALEAVPRLALPDGLVESLTEGEVSLALGALHKLTALRREQNKFTNQIFFVITSISARLDPLLLTGIRILTVSSKTPKKFGKKLNLSFLTSKLLFVNFFTFHIRQCKYERTQKSAL